jgi:hypothetical protein
VIVKGSRKPRKSGKKPALTTLGDRRTAEREAARFAGDTR